MVPLTLRFFLLLGCAAALRQVEDASRDQALAEALEEKEVPKRPKTPRRVQPRVLPSAMLEEEAEEQKCTGGYTKTGKKLGEGVFGAVYEVKKGRKKYAMKVPKKAGRAENLHEIDVMSATKKCGHVLPMIEAKPCVDGKIEAYAFVTLLLPWDLEKWGESTEQKVIGKCFSKVRSAIMDGLDCMHESGYLHNDLKDDNVLFEKIGRDGCPENMVLADFGNAEKIGSKMGKFMLEDYLGSWHMPPNLFEGIKEDSLGININQDQVLASPLLDKCSWALMAWDLFKKEDKELQKEMGKGKCGAMGPDRKTFLP